MTPQPPTQSYIHTSLHVRRPGCLCRVCAQKETGKQAKRKRQCPGYTLPPVHEGNPSSPLLPTQVFHIGQTSLRFHAFQCDSSSPPACDGSNSSSLPTPGVVSHSSLLILGSRCTHSEVLPMSDVELRTAEGPQLFTREVSFLLWRRKMSRASSVCGCFSRASKSRICIQRRLWLESILVPFHYAVCIVWGQSLFCITHTDKLTMCSK